MKRLYGILFLPILSSANAATTVGFTGAFAIANWTQTPGPGTINTSGAPTSVTLVSGDDQSGIASNTLFTILAPDDGLLTFKFVFNTEDDLPPNGQPIIGTLEPQHDPFIFKVDEVRYDTIDSTSRMQFGDLSVPVSKGSLISFNAHSLENVFGASTTTISDFTFTTSAAAIPEPGATLPLAALLCFGFLYRSRRMTR